MARKKQTSGKPDITNLSLLKHFVAVVQAGSFTQASDQLHLSQSVVSRSVRRLEDMLDVTLLERTTRKLLLTPAGEALFSETVASLDRIAVATADARRIGQGATASLRIGICKSVTDYAAVIQRGLRTFREIWPNVELNLCSVIGALQPGALMAADIDVGMMQLNLATSQGLEWQVLTRSKLMIAVPTIWGLASDGLKMDDLRDRPWLIPDPALSNATSASTLAILRSAGFEPIVGGFVDDPLTAHIMLGCGLGAALVHAHSSISQSEAYQFVPANVPGSDNFVETIVAWAPPSRSEQIASFVECLQAEAARDLGVGNHGQNRTVDAAVNVIGAL